MMDTRASCLKRMTRTYVAACLVTITHATAKEEGGPKVEPHGRFRYCILNLVKTTAAVDAVDQTTVEYADLLSRAWVQTFRGEVAVDARLHKRILLNVAYLAQFSHPFIYETYRGDAKSISAGLAQAKGVFLFGDVQKAALTLTVGLFDFKYNPDSRDLGEYLLLSSPYPGFVFSGLDSPKFVGIHGAADTWGVLHHDLLLTSEIYVFPAFDISVSYVATLRPTPVIEFGAGVSFYRLISVNEDNTTPPAQPTNVDPETGDAVQYSYRGTKLMGRLTFDPKPLFRPKKMGEHDLKLYAEATLLGVKNYPIYYDKITERVPVMAGFNIPVFGLLDYLAVEGEWYGSPYVNDPPAQRTAPYPILGERGDTDDIKWAVSAQRKVVDGIVVQARVASDHLRIEDGTGWFSKNNLVERTIAPDEWYWSVVAKFFF